MPAERALRAVPATRKPVKRSTLAAPAHLSASSKTWWQSIMADFELEAWHVRLLTAAAEAWDRCQEARAIVTVEGLTTKDRYGTAKPHPAVAIERDARLAFARLVRELNLDAAPPDPGVRPPRMRGAR